MNSLKELYIEELKDLYSANEQAGGMCGKLAEAASDERLIEILESSAEHCESRNEELAEIIKSYDEDPSDEHCKGMEGLVKEAKKHALDEDFEDESVQDAQIIAQFQRLSHYGLAGYGTCCAFAKQLGFSDDNSTLEKALKEIRAGDEQATQIAEGQVNKKAA